MELIKRLRTEPLDRCATRIDLMNLCREAADKLESNEREFASLLKITGTQACLTQKVEALALELDNVKAERDAAVYELCCNCGNYREAHNGACDGCQWKDA